MTPSNASLASLLKELPPSQVEAAINSLTDADASALLYDWAFWARPSQLAPEGDWLTWLILSGRNWGKTRTGSEWIKQQVQNGKRRIALVGRTSADCRKVMVEGEAGILSVFPPDQRPYYEPSRRQITFSNGAIAITYSSEEPNLLRGPSHDCAWADEVATFFDADQSEQSAIGSGTTWANLQMGLRLGNRPQQVVTTTPRPIKLLRTLIADPSTVVTRGSTYENRANTPDAYFSQIIQRYEGSRLGRQELQGEILEDVEGALWRREWIDQKRVPSVKARHLQKIVVSIDPAVTNTEDSDDTGIVVAALGVDGRGYVLDDLTCRMSPDAWARRAVAAYRDRDADYILAETNNGGDLVERVIRTVDGQVPYRSVHASRGKIPRAIPIAALYEQGRVSHVGSFPELEDELCGYTGAPGERSPGRLDSLVWALSELMIDQRPTPKVQWL